MADDQWTPTQIIQLLHVIIDSIRDISYLNFHNMVLSLCLLLDRLLGHSLMLHFSYDSIKGIHKLIASLSHKASLSQKVSIIHRIFHSHKAFHRLILLKIIMRIFSLSLLLDSRTSRGLKNLSRLD